MKIFEYKKAKNGFTLIELLVVISIIGLLSSVVLASLSNARAKARDAQRVAILKQVQTAIEIHASNNNGQYLRTISSNAGRSSSCQTFADTGGTCGQDGNGLCSQPVGSWDTSIGILVTNNLLPSVPKDPLNTGYALANRNYCFTYSTFPNGSLFIPGTPSSPSNHWHTMTCGGEPIGAYEYALLFTTENNNTQFPRFGISANIKYPGSYNPTSSISPWYGYSNCILGPLK